MGIATANGLVATLTELGMLQAEQLQEVRLLADVSGDSRELARQLLDREWLTAYQANQILQGKGQQLLLGPYLLLERIGSGGMGEIFKVRHRKLQRIAAIKVIHRQRIGQAVVVERFKREVEATAQLSHPNIVAVHDAGEDGGLLYLAMEWIDGIDLARLVRQEGPLPVSLACECIRQTALGLHHAHSKGFVHRDVKPQNLLIAPRGGMRNLQPDQVFAGLVGGTVKLLDLGLIRLQPQQRLDRTQLSLTQHGVVLGTVDYVAPEQARNSQSIDHRADLYSLGCTFHFLLTGKVPYPGSDPLDKLLKHQSEDPPSIRQIRPDVSDTLEQLVHCLMSKDPAHRPASSLDLVAALAPIANQAPSTVTIQVGSQDEGAAGFDWMQQTRVMNEPEDGDIHFEENATAICTPPRLPRGHGRWGELWWWLLAGAVAVIVVVMIIAALTRKTPRGRRAGVTLDFPFPLTRISHVHHPDHHRC